ncbi:MAG TPA: hypothetical protein VGK73_06080 [Polyangiaceae bacterium]
MNELPFDTVAIDDGPDQREVSALEFMRLPLSERIRLILGRQVTFTSEGRAVDRGVALKSLMEAARPER